MLHSVYLHIPFCTHRCAYCDFNTYAGQEGLMPAYVDALVSEIQLVGAAGHGAEGVHTIYLGGGTPTLLSSAQAGRLLDAVRGAYPVESSAEITIEANPGTLTEAALDRLRSNGFNRLSLGVQSANGEELRLLERAHRFDDVLRSLSAARRAGFENLNLDLIYGLPEQALTSWAETVRRVLDLHPAHISAYCLTFEHGTPFGQWAKRGLLPVPDPDLAADMYELAGEQFLAAGYIQYEISNWALPGHECRHNIQYWRTEPYLGFGAGAHGCARHIRYSNVLPIRSYVQRLRPSRDPRGGEPDLQRALQSQAEALMAQGPVSPAVSEHRRQTVADEMSDFMIMGLRLTREGVTSLRFSERFGQQVTEIYGPQLSSLTRQGLLQVSPVGTVLDHGGQNGAAIALEASFTLTPRGRLLGNRVFAEFVN